MVNRDPKLSNKGKISPFQPLFQNLHITFSETWKKAETNQCTLYFSECSVTYQLMVTRKKTYLGTPSWAQGPLRVKIGSFVGLYLKHQPNLIEFDT